MSPSGTPPLLSLLTALPLVGGFMLLASGPRSAGSSRRWALLANALSLAVLVLVWLRFDTSSGGLQLVERHGWVPSAGVEYHLGIDGLGFLMITLSAIVVPMAGLFTAPNVPRGGAYHGLLLLLQAGLFGAFSARNFVHWFLFWELSLIPAYFLVKLWGGPRRGPAARQFFIYTMVGSVALLLSFLATYVATGTFEFDELARRGRGLEGGLAAIYNIRLGWPDLPTRGLALLIFSGAFLGFAVKIPIWPFHTWLPLAYAEAPAPVAMVLTGALSKLGVYGLVGILLPIFPEQLWWVQTPLLWLTIASIVLSSMAALAQSDLRRMLGYLSISHLGYCSLGVLAAAQVTPGEARWGVEKTAALSGVMLQMLNHGIIAATLFGLAGWMENRTGGRRGLDDFGGLRQSAPVFCGVMGLSVFASLGLPGLNGFIGEFLIFKGALALAPWAAVLSSAGLLATAVFLLTFLHKVWLGPVRGHSHGFSDLTTRERWIVGPCVAWMLLMGLLPGPALGIINATVSALAERIAL